MGEALRRRQCVRKGICAEDGVLRIEEDIDEQRVQGRGIVVDRYCHLVQAVASHDEVQVPPP